MCGYMNCAISTKFVQRIFTKSQFSGFDDSVSHSLNMFSEVQHSSKSLNLDFIKIKVLCKSFVKIALMGLRKSLKLGYHETKVLRPSLIQ